MKRKALNKSEAGTALVATALLTLVLGLAMTAPAVANNWWFDSGQGARALLGTWRVQVTLLNCATGAPLGPAPFASLLTFADGGGATAVTSNPAFQPGQRTADHGIWYHTGKNSFVSSREAFILFTTDPNPPAPGFTRGTQRITEAIMVKGNYSTIVASVSFFDVNGNLLSTGCARAVGERFK